MFIPLAKPRNIGRRPNRVYILLISEKIYLYLGMALHSHVSRRLKNQPSEEVIIDI